MSIQRRPSLRPNRSVNTRLYQGWPKTSIFAPTARSLGQLAGALVATSGHRVWILSGSLGAGKTTFVRGALRRLGMRGVIASPTFTLAKQYHLSKNRIALHVDAYRIQSETELAALELHDFLAHSKSLVFVEWPERLPWVRWPKGSVWMKFTARSTGRQLRFMRLAGGRAVSVPRSRHRRSSRSQ